MRIWTLLCALVLLVGTSMGSQAYRLAYKDDAGTSRTYKTAMTISGAAQMGEISMPINGTVSMLSTEKVTGVKNGVATVTLSMSDGKMTMKVSGLPGDEATQTMEQALPTFSITFNRSPLGEITDVKMDGDLPGMGGMMGAEQLNARTQMPGQGIQFPDRDLKVGETWETKDSLKMPDGTAMDVTVHYTLAGTRIVEGKTYLEVVMDMSANMPKHTMKAGEGEQAATFTMGMTMKGQATTLFDEVAGEPYRTSMKMTMNMDMASPEMGNAKTNLVMDGTMTKVK